MHHLTHMLQVKCTFHCWHGIKQLLIELATDKLCFTSFSFSFLSVFVSCSVWMQSTAVVCLRARGKLRHLWFESRLEDRSAFTSNVFRNVERQTTIKLWGFEKDYVDFGAYWEERSFCSPHSWSWFSGAPDTQEPQKTPRPLFGNYLVVIYLTGNVEEIGPKFCFTSCIIRFI